MRSKGLEPLPPAKLAEQYGGIGKMSVEDNVKEVIVKTLSGRPDEIKLDEKLYDSLGVDSTEMVDLRVALEKKFGIKLDAKEVAKDSVLRDIIVLIEGKTG
jgi:acyl carrier protein